MKKIKINQCLCLLLVTVCLILFMTSVTVFAAHTDGSTKVTASIETASTETTQLVTDEDSNSDLQDESNVSTGDIVSVCVTIVLLVLLVSMIVIFLCSNKSIDEETKQID